MFWPSEEGQRVAIGSPDDVAEAVLDATSAVVVGVDWLTADESLVEVIWLEATLLCESVAVLDATETLLELEAVD